jgi:hypothetical protein
MDDKWLLEVLNGDLLWFYLCTVTNKLTAIMFMDRDIWADPYLTFIRIRHLKRLAQTLARGQHAVRDTVMLLVDGIRKRPLNLSMVKLKNNPYSSFLVLPSSTYLFTAGVDGFCDFT